MYITFSTVLQYYLSLSTIFQKDSLIFPVIPNRTTICISQWSLFCQCKANCWNLTVSGICVFIQALLHERCASTFSLTSPENSGLKLDQFIPPSPADPEVWQARQAPQILVHLAVLGLEELQGLQEQLVRQAQ